MSFLAKGHQQPNSELIMKWNSKNGTELLKLALALLDIQNTTKLIFQAII